MITDELYEKLVAIRHQLHAHPELSNQEIETTAFLRAQLEALGIEILESDLPTGFVARIGSGKPVIALRADIDALPITEMTGLDFASENHGVMHACGHDFHMTSLLGAAILLKSRESELTGTVKLIFQPAEEVGTGAKAVLATQLLDDVEAFVGFHNLPTLPVGTIGLREQGVMAAVEQFRVVVKGQGAHAAYPHESTDPIIATAAMIQNLQSIVARNVPPLQAAVLSVTHIEAGNTWNVLPDSAFFEGTISTFDASITQLTKKRFTEIVDYTAKTFAVSADIQWVMGSEVTYNDPALTQCLTEEMKSWHDAVIVPEPSSAGEDFASYKTQAPSVFAFIGTGHPSASGLHFSDMRVADEALPVAVSYYLHAVKALHKFYQ